MTVIQANGKKGELQFHADTPLIVAPKILSSKIENNVTYYIGENGKKYIADLYDKYFKTVKTKMKGKFHKGDLIGNAAVWE
jgi:hypothetical protein